jgi:hypothetical protein
MDEYNRLNKIFVCFSEGSNFLVLLIKGSTPQSTKTIRSNFHSHTKLIWISIKTEIIPFQKLDFSFLFSSERKLK